MNFSNILAMIALVFNAVTLIIVLYQTRLSNESYKVSRKSYDEDKMLREIELLPKVNYIIHVSFKIDQWINHLSVIKEELTTIKIDQNGKALEQISREAPNTCEGLVEKSIYEECSGQAFL